MEEIYKVLTDFPAYRISNKGNIQSRWKRGENLSGFQNNPWKNLKPGTDGKGYLTIILCDGDGKRKSKRIHNLVAEYFIGPKPKDKQVVRHLDSNPKNNYDSNLAYGTHLENEHDKIDNGTWNTRNGGAKITIVQVKEIREKLKTISQKELAIMYGISRPTITRIANNKIWKNV